jgi:hypothetical protein
MDTATTPTARPLSRSAFNAILFDRAGLDGLEVQESSWDEWDIWSDVQLMRMNLDRRHLPPVCAQ